MTRKNEMRLEFDSYSGNESFARVAVAAFLTQMDPTLEEVADVKTSVSEAVTNSVVHGYEGREGKIVIECRMEGDEFQMQVSDMGCGIENVELAMEPLFTTKPEEDRSGMGFCFMEAFMDEIHVESAPGKGTRVFMKKRIGKTEEPENQ